MIAQRVLSSLGSVVTNLVSAVVLAFSTPRSCLQCVQHRVGVPHKHVVHGTLGDLGVSSRQTALHPAPNRSPPHFFPYNRTFPICTFAQIGMSPDTTLVSTKQTNVHTRQNKGLDLQFVLDIGSYSAESTGCITRASSSSYNPVDTTTMNDHPAACSLVRKYNS